MNKTLINPAVFSYSLYVKFADWKTCIPLFLLFLMPTFTMILISVMTNHSIHAQDQKQIGEAIGNYFRTPIILLLVTYSFVSEGPSGRKLIGDADTLGLLFTRPISRFSYVLSKFAASVVGTATVLSLGLIVTWALGFLFNITGVDIGPYAFLAILINAMSWSALMTFLHCAQPAVSLTVYLFLTGAQGMGTMFASFAKNSNQLFEIYRQTCLAINHWLGDLMPEPFDFSVMIANGGVDFYQLIITLTNIVFFIFLAGAALSYREFFYGSD